MEKLPLPVFMHDKFWVKNSRETLASGLDTKKFIIAELSHPVVYTY